MRVSPGPWLSSLDIDYEVGNVPFSADALVNQIELLSYSMELVYLVNPEYNHYQFISCVELLKSNALVCRSDSRLQTIVNTLADMMVEVPELSAYADDFKRRCLDESHREAARKRLVSFYFSRCEDLCDDVIEKVLGMM
jgi:hypothetical protein